MRDYPTPSEYQEALQVPEAALEDPELQNATPATNALGLPQPITGAFAAVFPVRTDTGRRLAVKCFLQERPGQEERYYEVARYLESVEIDSLIRFEYQDEGIVVEGQACPLLKMEWAEGTPLNRYVEDHLDEPERLIRLADAWADLLRTLESSDLAHGDLQHGNILVQEGDEVQIRLVDYDTVYVPALDGWSSPEVGHRNYQHPDRTDADFGPFLDRFPGLAIYVALQACAVRPDLWHRYDSGENLLFRDSDFYEPESSPLFDDLSSTDHVSDLAEALHTACYLDPTDVPRLSDVREGGLERAAVSIRTARRERGRSTTDRSRFARLFLPTGLAVGLVCGGILLVGHVASGLSVVLTACLIGGGWARYRYRTLSLVRRRRRLQQERDRFSETVRGLEREVESLKEKRSDLMNSIDERREQRLEEVREEALRDRLKHHFVGEVREVEGIIHKHVVRLKASNIRTAYEATPEALEEVRRISDEARARISMWRSALVREYEDDIPDSLSPAEERRLRRFIDHRIEDIDDQIDRTKEKIEVQKTEREQIRQRLDEMPSFSFPNYLAYLLRLTRLPADRDGPPVPTPRSRDDTGAKPEPVPAPADEDGKWWDRS